MRRDHVFVSYRRSDVPATVATVRAILVSQFGDGVVFVDTEAIGPGEEFPTRLRDELTRAAFTLVMIGPRWNDFDAQGNTRLSNPLDWVRVEVEAALRDHDSTVIPILVDGAEMPLREPLPESMMALTERNAVRLRTQNIDEDVWPLVERVSERISPIGAAGEKARLRLDVRDQLGSVLAGHVWALWELLLPHREEMKFAYNPPLDFHVEDLKAVHRVLQWLRDVAGAHTDWWRDPRDLVTVDATVWVASDLLDRLMPSTESQSEFEGIIDRSHERRRTAMIRMTRITERQGEMGNAEDAAETASLLRTLREVNPPKAYTARLDAYIRQEDQLYIIGERPFDFMRSEVSYIVDHLRPDRIEVDGFGEPRQLDPPPAITYRWGRLLRPTDDTTTAWEKRFADDSWFRLIMQRGRDEYPSGELGSFFR
nr:toll/interleukin-1 receptor domain-containing protein [Modestobacter altitudinis]